MACRNPASLGPEPMRQQVGEADEFFPVRRCLGETVIETGIKGYEVSSWNGLSVPHGTPGTVVATLNAAMKEVIPTPDVQGKSGQMGMAMRWSTSEDMTARMKADITKWGAVIEKAGIPRHD